MNAYVSRDLQEFIVNWVKKCNNIDINRQFQQSLYEVKVLFFLDVIECETENGGCLNGATCINTIGSFTCECPNEYRDALCQECWTTCQEGRVITARLNQYFLFLVIGGCFSSPCKNGGTCVPNLDVSYDCVCPDNLAGKDCEEATTDNFRYLVIDERMNWASAQNKCVERGYNLTSITAENELDFLAQFVG